MRTLTCFRSLAALALACLCLPIVAAFADIEDDVLEAEISAALTKWREAKIPPDVSIGFEPTIVDEDGGTAGLVVRLSKVWKTDVSISLSFSGTAGAEDYVASATTVVIPAGQLGTQVVITTASDDEVEERESVVATVDTITSGRRFIGGDATLWINSYDLPPPPPPPPPVDPPPEPQEPFPPVLPSVKAGRFLWPADILDRIAAAPTVWADTVKYAEAIKATKEDKAKGIPARTYEENLQLAQEIRPADQAVCSAAVWLAGRPVVAGVTYAYSLETYLERAIDGLMRICQKPILLAGSHYNWTHVQPVALAYIWLRDQLTDEQRAIVRARIVEALDATIDGQKSLDMFWSGYNLDAGAGMTLALAVHGETATDYVSRWWYGCWWSVPPASAKGIGGLYNREYERDWQPDGGTREGWPYLWDQASLAFTRGVYESATGDRKSLSYPWFDRMPLLILHQSLQIPQVDAKGKPAGWRPFSIPTYEYGGEYWWQPGAAYLLAAGTGNRDPQIAALSAWLLSRWTYSKPTGCEELIFRCLIGDPRVKPQSPVELGLCLEYTTAGTGYHYDRSDWRDDEKTTRVYFGAGETLVRNEPRGDVAILVGGYPIIAGRTGAYAHDYSGPERMNVILLRDEKAFLKRLGGSQTPVRLKTCSFRRDGESFVAELQGLYPGKASLMRRTWHWDQLANVVTVLDEVQCVDGVTPIVVWNTPCEPKKNADGSLLFSNELTATALVTFDRPLPETSILVRGGETDGKYSQLFDGSFHAGEIDAEWSKSSRAEQIRAGGFHTVYVTPPKDADGVFRVRTTFQINRGVEP